MSSANGLMTIGQVARTADVASSTLRYYERAGLIRPAERSPAGYRLYGRAAVERLQFVRAAQAVGFTLDDIRTLLELESQDAENCRAEVQPLIERRIAEIDRKLGDLKRVRRTLAGALGRCRKSDRECPVVADLKRKHAKRRTR